MSGGIHTRNKRRKTHQQASKCLFYIFLYFYDGKSTHNFPLIPARWFAKHFPFHSFSAFNDPNSSAHPFNVIFLPNAFYFPFLKMIFRMCKVLAQSFAGGGVGGRRRGWVQGRVTIRIRHFNNSKRDEMMMRNS